MRKEAVVAGAGFSGSVMARCLAEDGCRVRVVEKRGHIAGNMYDYVDENGIRIQKYGPHTFHTAMEAPYHFITRFCDLKPYRTKCEAVIDGIPTPSPFNFKTIDQFYDPKEGTALKQKLLDYYKRDHATILEMLESRDEEIRNYAQFLFVRDYSQYTAKQWGKRPGEIDPSVLGRVPVLFSYRDTYFDDPYEGLPAGGYTALFEAVLDHPFIEVCLETDAMDHIRIDRERHRVLYDGMDKLIIFTGEIDLLFDYIYGYLPYRSLYFEYEHLPQKSWQNAAITAYPSLEVPYTRITEYTKLPCQDVGEHTVIAKEYPIPYVLSEINPINPIRA